MIYNIIEVANTHGGDKAYLNKLIDRFSVYGDGFGIKFQPLHPDKIATPDYEFHSVYQQFYFTAKEWSAFIQKANRTKDVWLDLFDEYGVQIFNENASSVRGLKLQASVLNNYEVLNALSDSDLSKTDLIINISAYTVDEIRALAEEISGKLSPGELLLEIGFQAYPTELSDSGFSKIEVLKKEFDYRLVFADHLDATTHQALYFPVIASLAGVDFIEKHVRLSDETKYDYFSALSPDDYKAYIELQKNFLALKNEPFINEREVEYLEKSLMKPQLARDMKAGSIPDVNRDFRFRRSGKEGMNIVQIKEKLAGYSVLSEDCREGDSLTSYQFKKANIATIIACRLKSTRLDQKALKKIGDLTSIEYCIRNTLRFPGVNHTVLATSDLESDSRLSEYTFSPSVIFHRGDPDDVIQRYLDIIEKLNIDVFIRVTGDNPFVDHSVCEFLLEEHFKNGAEYTTAKKAAGGSNLEIINAGALKRIRKHFKTTEYSEYMSFYFLNNPDYFKIHLADLPEKYVRDYRLTLDFDEDLKLCNEIHNNLFPKKKDFDLLDVFALLDHSDLAMINQHIQYKYKEDIELINTLKEKTTIPSE